MTKTKKLNKIIPAVLLSGAMVISTPHLISPIISNAYENSGYSVNKDYKKYLSDLKYKPESESDNNLLSQVAKVDNDFVIPSGASATFDLNKQYSELNTYLSTSSQSDPCPLRFEFYLDGRQITKVTVKPNSDKKATHFQLNLTGADKLQIKVFNDGGYGSTYSFMGRLNNAELTPNNKI